MAKKIFRSKELKLAFNVLNEAGVKLNNQDFNIVKLKIKEVLDEDPKIIKKLFSDGISPYQWAYSAIANVTGDLLESGQFHIYREVLNPLGPGKNLLKLYDSAVDELVKMSVVDSDTANIEKKALRKNIRNVG